MAIKAIIWDVGGVLERTENQQPRNDLALKLGISSFDLGTIIFGNDDKFRIQLGEISMAEHQNNVAKKLGLAPEDMENVFSQFFAGDVLDLSLVEYIRKLNNKYYSAIISNYADKLRAQIVDTWKIGDAFDQIICSAEVGLMKPGPEIYLLTLEKIGFAANETVFIDDFTDNIEAAKNLGMHGIVFKNKDQAIKDLDSLLDIH